MQKKPYLDSEKKQQKKEVKRWQVLDKKDQYDLFLANIFFESAVTQ